MYLQDLGDAFPLVTESPLLENKAESYQLQYNDVVDIQIQTTSEELNMIFGVSAAQAQAAMAGVQGANQGGDIFFLQGYTIDEEGNIDLPLIGSVSLLNLTIPEAKEKIEGLMMEYIRKEDLYVRVRLGGIRFATLGEFFRNGNHTILANQVNIYQAIAHAGDMTPIAKRDEVVLIRQYPEGTKSFRLNLNDKRLMETEFFFLRPNDMLYAEPLKVRELGAGVDFVQTLQFTVSILTAALLIINTVNQ
ncbi:polysaccharide export protein [Nitritalea halalkaliphila LW7]|uniref:Polysaccharide export protein n=1 Tax=Nitritalea halalkaliphila LW7 TaxID=1189621 RepID=I5C5Z7_9BACT|nr:polysaccharide biosynthesis/export family protein [Nitritalea halalkaliphila]EIM77249.1 polysaccharide export protein [Nitritalea halalkaliphila LW7]